MDVHRYPCYPKISTDIHRYARTIMHTHGDTGPAPVVAFVVFFLVATDYRSLYWSSLKERQGSKLSLA